MDFFLIHRILQKYDLPKYVRTTKVAELEPPEDLPKHLFADEYLRAYPCHNAASVVMSAAELMEDRGRLTPTRFEYIKGNILKHAEFFNITDDVEKIFTHKAEEDIVYGLTLEENGSTKKLFPLRNEAEVKAASDYILEHWKKLPYEYRETIAKNILAVVERDKIPFADYRSKIEKIAGLCVVNKNLLREYLQEVTRKITTEDKHTKIACDILASVNLALDLIDADDNKRLKELVKIACNIAHDLDFPNEPLEQFVSTSESEIKEYNRDHIFLNNGDIIKVADVRVNREELRRVFGSQFEPAFDMASEHIFLDRFKKIAEELDEDQSDELVRLLKLQGTKIYLRKSREKLIPSL